MKRVDVRWMPDSIHVGEQPGQGLLALVLVDGYETTLIPLAHSDARRIARNVLELVDDAIADEQEASSFRPELN